MGGGCGHVSLWAVFFLQVDSSEACPDVVRVEVKPAFFEAEPGQYPGCGYLVGSGEALRPDSEGLWAILYVYDDVFEVDWDEASVE